MKRGFKLTILFIMATSIFLNACDNNKDINTDNSSNNLNSNNSDEQVVPFDNSTNENGEGSDLENGSSDSVEDVKLKLTFNNEEVIVRMIDNPTSRDFITLLPLTLTLEDYAGTEKINYLQKELSTEEAPSGIDPSIGDFTYFAPWGNLAIYYKDFGYSNGLIKIGEIESGLEKLESMTGDFTVEIEKIN